MTEGKKKVFPGDLDGKVSACDAGDPASVPGLGTSPGEGNGKFVPLNNIFVMLLFFVVVVIIPSS